MSLAIQLSDTQSERLSVTLAVALESSKKLAVRAGAFTAYKKDYILTEDWFWTLPTDIPDTGMAVTGSLVEVRATGEAAVLVDEKELGPDGEDFTFDGSPYKLLYELFNVTLSAGVASLAGLDILIRHTQPLVKKR